MHTPNNNFMYLCFSNIRKSDPSFLVFMELVSPFNSFKKVNKKKYNFYKIFNNNKKNIKKTNTFLLNALI